MCFLQLLWRSLVIFKHCSLIQEGESVLFYRYNRVLKGYMINGLFVANNLEAKLAFVKVWKYFVSEVVQADDMYCSVLLDSESDMFSNYLTFHEEIDGIKIYKVDNFLKEQFSAYTKHLESQTNE